MLRAGLWALTSLVSLNALVAWQLVPLLASQPGSINDLALFERRLEAFPAKHRVKVLVVGNSHAVAGLKPPLLAPALGLAPEEVFSLAVPSATADEMRVLLEQHLPRFPNVALAVYGIDELLLGTQNDMHMRFLTRSHLDQRLEYAMKEKTLEQRVSVTASWFWPMIDYAEPIKRNAPGYLKGLILPAHQPHEHYQKRIARIPYVWGYPPPWNHPLGFGEAERRASWSRNQRMYRAYKFADATPHVDAGLRAVARAADLLAARNCKLVLAEMPTTSFVRKRARLRRPASYARYDQKLAAFVTQSGLPWIPAPTGWEEELFFDADHLANTGAERLTRWVTPHLRSALEAERPR